MQNVSVGTVAKPNHLPAGEWGLGFASSPDLCSVSTGWSGALLRRWRGTSPDMHQPRLDHHYLVLHLGGAKRVTRRGDGADVTVDAGVAAITSVPAGASHDWSTQGPIGFAHLYIAPAAIDRAIQERFDRDPRRVEMVSLVGEDVPLLAALVSGLMAEVESPGPASRLVLDSLLQSLLVHLISRYSTVRAATGSPQHSLAPRRLRRVLDFIDANLSVDLELGDLASVAGSSRFHFSRAFRDATGFPPYRYLVHRRIEAAKTLLLEDRLTIEQVSATCGFRSNAQFCAMFKQTFGTTPARFRREH